MAIARAFIAEPQLLLADEPTGNLDAATGRLVIDCLFEHHARHGTTLLLITHDPSSPTAASGSCACWTAGSSSDRRTPLAVAGRCRPRRPHALRRRRRPTSTPCGSPAASCAAASRGLRVFLACLVLGVAAIAAIGSLAAAVERRHQSRCRDLLGGDAEARLAYRPAGAAERAFLTRSGTLSEIATMRAMARTRDGERRSLIELKAVDAAYPLYGAVALAPAQRLAAALDRRGGRFGAAVDPAILGRLGLAVGDDFKIGDAVLQLARHDRARARRGIRRPRSSARGSSSRPAALAETGLIRPGALVNYHYRLRLAPGTDAAAWATRRAPPFPRPAGRSAALAKPRRRCSG